MKWSALTDGLPVMATFPPPRGSDGDPEVTALCYDSRRVVPGAVFVAIDGFSVDGHRFVAEAVKKGAVAVVSSRPAEVCGAAGVQVADSRAALAFLACRFYGYPADALTLVGVTGTSGKTTVAWLLESILKSAGIPVGVIGTLNYRYGEKIFSNPVTTPESADLQAIFRNMVDSGITHCVMEVSSHALELSRVAGCRFDAGIFTNLSHDHLDYHQTLENYWQAKLKLFECHLKPADVLHPVRAVINGDDTHGDALARKWGPAAYRTSATGNGDITPAQTVRDPDGIRGQISTPAGTVAVDTRLVGDFNLDNILSAIGGALALGIPLPAVAAGINRAACVPGRLERISDASGRFVFVDYSHKPDALENAIAALRRMTPGGFRLITVFGCGGDRDQTKRPMMGKIAAANSDLAVITSDNPRSEDPMGIIKMIEDGARSVSRQITPADLFGTGAGAWAEPGTGPAYLPAYLVEPDRRAAIGLAIGAARPGDTVLIAGKGHETYQILANKTLHFDDREVARDVLAALNGGDR